MAEYIYKEQAIDKFIEGDGDDEFTEGYNFAVNEYREKIKAMPAADVQPIRRGRWINDGDCMLCSCCNYAYNSWFMGSNYCPKCGARMDGDTE